MSVVEIVSQLESLGVSLWEESGQLRFRAPQGVMTDARRAALRDRKDAVLEHLRQGSGLGQIAADPAGRYEPFPLTDVQAAYLLGRRDFFAYGGVACHAYGELRLPTVDPPRLEAAWRALIRRHDMLRAVIDVDGFQRVLPDTPDYHIAVADLRGASDARVEMAIQSVREELDHRIHAPELWPLFELRVTLAADRAVLHLSIDFLIADYVSIYLILDELRHLYTEPTRVLPPLEITFRDYLLAERRLRGTSRYQRDREYWWARIDALPPAPELPVLARAATERDVRFRRWEMVLDEHEWTAFQRRAAAGSLTAAGAILAAYAEVIGRWSRHPRFTLDITLLQRLPVHPQVNQLVGDFTSINLLAVELDASRSFCDRARALQGQLWEDLDHRLCSGVEVVREIARRRGAGTALMPVVFTSAIGLNDANPAAGPMQGFGELTYGISQTPQVWIDCQVIERGGALALNWDVRDGVFPEDVIEAMFGAFERLVRRLATESTAWTESASVPLPDAQQERRRLVNATAAPLSGALLHEALVRQALRTPDRIAVIAPGQSLRYGELLGRAMSLAELLRRAGCKVGDVVAVTLEKGPDQVVAALGALLAGAAYLPIDADQPAARRQRMLADAKVTYVLTGSDIAAGDWPHAGVLIAVDIVPAMLLDSVLPEQRVSADDLAYVIYTSGSTGSPKGVMVTHRSAVNTIEDINRRFGVTASDRILGLSNLGFDLSVYDIFGPLAVGGRLVLPEPGQRADPSHWAQLAAEHGVTLWNSVPAQAQMLADYLATAPERDLPMLRLAMLSGDWIPTALPDHLRARLPHLQLASLGGATEAAIWSIYYPIGDVKPTWRSIPYGKPLTNQTFHVLDAALRPCPEWTTGELYIGGVGLAQGYYGDEKKTAERFIRHPDTGERLYRTGDLGRYFPDGNIEFLGREDFQIKIRGYRIELGEVEAAFQSHPAVARAAAVVMDGERAMDRRLAVFVEPARRPDPAREQLRIVDAVLASAAASPNDAHPQLVRFAKQLDRTALVSMIHALRQQGLFRTPAESHSLEEILARARVAPKHHRLIRRWLNALERHGLLERAPVSLRYGNAQPLDAAAVEAAWREAESLQPETDRRTELIAYFKNAGRHLPELMRGELDAARLLFPEGRTEISEVAYNDNFLSKYINGLVTASIRHIAGCRAEGQGPLRVLEAGAGVGGASTEVIAALAGNEVDYLFTDVSPFFVNHAKERFREYPWVRYGLFDINLDVRGQGFVPNSFDIIVCANVLHYGRNASRVLDRMRELLAPGGWLVFVEMVRDNYQVLTSVEFLLDATGEDFDDVRQGRDETFITREQWCALVEASGGEVGMCLPDREHPLAAIGFHVFAARFKRDVEPLTIAGLTAHVAERLPEYMRPAHVQIVDAIPVTGSGKTDRQVLRTWLPSQSAQQAAASHREPETDLERRLAAVWAGVLGVQRVARDQDFFGAGGDSLSAAQLVGRLREEIPEARSLFFDSLLRVVLESPTIASLAVQLASTDTHDGGATPRIAASPLVHLGGTGDQTPRVLTHDASGTLASYEALLGPLAERGPLFGLVVSESDEYLALQPSVLVERLAGDYARRLRADGHDRVRLVGYHAGGILAAEVARHLAESGALVEDLTLVAADPIRCVIDDELLTEYLFARGAGIDPVRLGFPAEVALARALDSIRRDSPDRVPDGRLVTLGGDTELESVAWCFRRLAARSSEDRLAAIGRAVVAPGSPSSATGQVSALYNVFRHSLHAFTVHDVSPYAGDMTLLRPQVASPVWRSLLGDTTGFWETLCLGELRVLDTPEDVWRCLRAPNATPVVELLTAGRPHLQTAGR